MKTCNMKIEEIVNNLNKIILSERDECKNDDRSFLMIHKTITPHEVIKAFKEISMSLWFINPSNNIKTRVITINKCSRILSGQEDKAIEEISKVMLYKIFQLIRTEDFNNIVNGEYRNKSEEIIA